MAVFLTDPPLGFVVVEEQGSLSLSVEIQPSALGVSVEERIDSLVRPEPAHLALPKPQTGRRAFHGEDPTEVFVANPAICVEIEVPEPAARPPIGGGARLGVDPARGGWDG